MRIRSQSELVWVYIAHTEMHIPIDMGQDMTWFSGLKYPDPNLIVTSQCNSKFVIETVQVH